MMARTAPSFSGSPEVRRRGREATVRGSRHGEGGHQHARPTSAHTPRCEPEVLRKQIPRLEDVGLHGPDRAGRWERPPDSVTTTDGSSIRGRIYTGPLST